MVYSMKNWPNNSNTSSNETLTPERRPRQFRRWPIRDTSRVVWSRNLWRCSWRIVWWRARRLGRIWLWLEQFGAVVYFRPSMLLRVGVVWFGYRKHLRWWMMKDVCTFGKDCCGHGEINHKYFIFTMQAWSWWTRPRRRSLSHQQY
jgi:hypothetical protein